tara:strand:+ start:233 stop:628 length:396 start_codon:yes stop_codon:yes gene_type:complete
MGRREDRFTLRNKLLAKLKLKKNRFVRRNLAIKTRHWDDRRKTKYFKMFGEEYERSLTEDVRSGKFEADLIKLAKNKIKKQQIEFYDYDTHKQLAMNSGIRTSFEWHECHELGLMPDGIYHDPDKTFSRAE